MGITPSPPNLEAINLLVDYVLVSVRCSRRMFLPDVVFSTNFKPIAKFTSRDDFLNDCKELLNYYQKDYYSTNTDFIKFEIVKTVLNPTLQCTWPRQMFVGFDILEWDLHRKDVAREKRRQVQLNQDTQATENLSDVVDIDI